LGTLSEGSRTCLTGAPGARRLERRTPTVSPDAHDGWRRTRLPDGQTAYVANAGLDFGASPDEAVSAPSGAPPPVQPIVAAPSVPLQAKLYVGDVGSLAALVPRHSGFDRLAEAG
jgi:hypothetical protein